MFDLFLARQVIAIAASAASAYTDLKTGLIYDGITLPMIALGILLNLYEQQFGAILVAGIVFAIGYVLYFGGKIGGGDVKLFTGIALVMPEINGSVFVINTFIFSALAAVMFLSIYYPLKYLRKTKSIRAAFDENKQGVRRGIVLSLVLLAYFYFLFSTGIASETYLIIIAIPMFFGVLFFCFEKGIKEKIFLEKIPVGKIEEDELIAKEFLDKKTLEGLSLGPKGIIDAKAAEKLRALGVKEILVYRNLPRFGPFILFGVVAAIYFPNFFLF